MKKYTAQNPKRPKLNGLTRKNIHFGNSNIDVDDRDE